MARSEVSLIAILALLLLINPLQVTPSTGTELDHELSLGTPGSANFVIFSAGYLMSAGYGIMQKKYVEEALETGAKSK